MEKFFLTPLLIIIGCLALIYSSKGQSQSHNEMKVSRIELATQISNYIEKEMVRQKIVGLSAAIIDFEGILIAEGYGLADKEQNVAATSSTLFPIASLTKTFTGIAVMQLVERGLIDLDNPIVYYIPELSISGGEEKVITTRMLLTHHSGIQGNILYNWLLPEVTTNKYAYNQIVPLINEIGTIFKPGMMHAYSNSGYALLGVLIERVAGVSYPDYIQTEILKPLEMQKSIVFAGEGSDMQVTKGYDKGKSIVMPMKLGTSAGGMAICAEDAAKYLKALVDSYHSDSPLISSRSLRDMMEQQNEDVALDKGFSMGITWFIQSPVGFNTRYASHRGELPPFHSMIVILPELKAGVLIAVNSNKAALAPSEMAHKIVSILYQHYTGKQAKPFTLPGRISQPPALSSDFEGYYPNVFMGTLKVQKKRKRVVMKSTVIPVPLELYPLSDGTYSMKAKLMGFVPLPIKLLKSVQVDFREVEGKRFIVWNFENSLQNPELKVDPMTIPKEYKIYEGKYRVINMDNCERVVDNVEFIVGKRGGFCTFKYEFLGRYNFNMAIQPLDDRNATIAGEGYFVGERIRWEVDKDRVLMYWSGLVFENTK